ncbi:capsid protein [Thermus phage phiFa]|nr:capsid protein [Thermus phage phiFa]
MARFTGFSKVFSVGQKFHDSLEGLLRSPLAISGTLAGGYLPRRGRPVRYDPATDTFAVVIHSRVTPIDAANGKAKLSAYDGLTVGDSVVLVKSDGTTQTATIAQLQAPVYDPVSTLQTNEDFVVLQSGTAPVDLTGVVYLAPAGTDLTRRVDGIVYEDADENPASVAVEVDGAKVEHVLGADIASVASALGFKVISGLVFFRV